MTDESIAGKASKPAAKGLTRSTSGDGRLVVVDIGRKMTKKAIKQLRAGKGKWIPRITDTVKSVQEESGATDALPIIIVVERKRKRRGLIW